MRANDAPVGLVILVLAALMLAVARTFPGFPGQPYGPSLFPSILAVGLMICGVLLIVRGLALRRAGEAWFAFAPWARRAGPLFSLVLVLAAIVFYIMASDRLGFIPVALILLVVLFARFQVRWRVALPVAVVGTLIIHWFFGSMLRVPLPRGLLDTIL